jgi:hypothetical protein
MPTATITDDLTRLWRVPRVIDGNIVLDEKDVIAVFELKSKLNPITADSKDMEAAHATLQRAIDSLKAGERVQLIVDCKRYDPTADIGMMRERTSESATPGFRTFYPDLLDRYLQSYCQANLVPVYRFFILFTYKAPPNPLAPKAEGNLKQVMQEVARRSRDFVGALTDSKLGFDQLGEAAILDLLDDAANPSRLTALSLDAFKDAPAEAGVESSRAELLYRSPVVVNVPKSDRRFSLMQVGRKFVKTLSFKRPPLGFGQDAVSSLLLSQQEFRWVMFVEGVSQQAAALAIQKKRRSAAGAVSFGGGKEVQASEEQAREYDELLRAHARKEMRFVRWSSYLTLFNDDEQALHQAAADVAGAFVDLVPDEGIYRQLEYWQSGMPLASDKAGNVLMAQSDAVAGLFPFFNFRSTSPEGGVLLGFSPANEPCFFDPWSSVVTNGNVFVTGQAGAGKSYLINNILNRLGPMAYDVSIIDKAKSYRTTCACLGGDYIEFDMEGKHAVNVWDVLDFDPKLEADGLNDLDAKGRILPAKIEVVIGLAEILLAEEGQALPKLDRSLLQEDIEGTYARCLKQDEAGKVDPKSVPTFADLAETLGKRIEDPKADFRHERKLLLQKLSPAVTGNLAGLVNRRTTMKTDRRARVFDISGLPDQENILGVAMYVLTTWLFRHWRRNKSLGIRQIGVIDEMYFFMKFNSGRSLLDNLARRSRHLGLMPFFATQQLADVMSYPETRSILDNCQTMFLFKQAKNVVDSITEILRLTDREREHLESLQQVRGVYSNAFFIYGSQRNILTVRPDPATRWINTTEPTYDVPRVSAAIAAAGGDAWAAVETLVAQDLN